MCVLLFFGLKSREEIKNQSVGGRESNKNFAIKSETKNSPPSTCPPETYAVVGCGTILKRARNCLLVYLGCYTLNS